MTWEIVTGLIVLVGFIASIATWVSKLTKILTSLEDAIRQLRETLTEIKTNNREDHKRIFTTLADLERRVREVELELRRGED